MPKKSPRIAPCQSLVETLEARQLLSVVDVTRFGAVPGDGRDDTAAFAAAIRGSRAGDVVSVPTGSFNLSDTLVMPSGLTLKGATGATMTFAVGSRDFAIEIAGNAANVTITGLSIRANNGIIDMRQGRGYSNIQIVGNDFVWGYAGTYYNRLAVKATVQTDRLKIEQNFFHDSPTSDRNVDLWYLSNSSYSYNKFYLVNDGGHILESRNNVVIQGNVGRKIHRMGIEIQGLEPSNNMLVANNIFYDWDRPWNDTFGLSVMPMLGTNIFIRNNYLSADFTGEWGVSMPGTGGPRFGIGIEAGFTTGDVSGNKVIGPWVTGVAAAMANTKIDNNDFYGSARWGWLTGEPGVRGHGSYVSTNNRFHDLADAPQPDFTIAGTGTNPFPFDPFVPGSGGDGGATPAGPPPTGDATLLSAFVVDSGHISLGWVDSFTDEDGYVLERSRDGQTFVPIFDSLRPGVVRYEDTGLPSGTQLWYRVAAYKGDVFSRYSNSVGPKTKGLPNGSGGGGSTAPTPGQPPLNPVVRGFSMGGATPSSRPPIVSDPTLGLNGPSERGGVFSGVLI